MLAGGRWHRKGLPVVYCTDHPSTALLEILVHTTLATIPDTYQLIEIDVPDDISVMDASLPEGWREDQTMTQDIGTAFLNGRAAALLRVPSAIMPKAENLLLNPRHGAAARITVAEAYRYPFDSRLLR